MLTFKFEGMREFRKRVEKATFEKEQRIKEEVKNSTLAMEARQKKDAPYNEGHLGRDISHDFTDNGFTGETHTTVEHSLYNEFGTGIHAENGNGRRTPWAFPKRAAGNKEYDLPVIMINGEEYYVTRGQKPQKFFFKNFDHISPLFEREIQKIVEEGGDI